MEKKLKILVCGDVCGHYKQLFQRVETINKKAGPFEILLCVGDFFGSEEQNEELIAYKNGCKNVPVPTYILGPSSEDKLRYYAETDDGEICSNLTYLGKRGLFTLSSGVKIAYLSGLEAPAGKTGSTVEEPYFNKEDVAAIRNSCLVNKNSSCDYKGVDILLTSQWPAYIKDDCPNASKLISFLSKEIRPRYHFCGLNNKNYEPPPYRISADKLTQLELSTRFIALAHVGNTCKEKYIYALSLTPVEKMRILDLIQKTTNETKCPFESLDFKNCLVHNENQSDGQQFFFDMNARNDNNGQHKRGRRNGLGSDGDHDKRPRIQHIDQEKCWFCLSSPNVEKHLVISIGKKFYLALAKGPINDYHVLILSITHIPAASLLSAEDWQELTKFKKALRQFFKSQEQVVCFTERHYKSSHLQINALGIDAGYAWKIQHAFEDKAEEYNLQFETLAALDSPTMLPQQGPYFVAELTADTTLITRQMKHFPLHFAREVFCSENLLNCDEKVNWKDCKLDKDEEIAMVKSFREKFKQYDFTL